MDKIRVLIADDHTLLRQGLRKIIESEENLVVVGEAGTGDEVVARARELSPDVVLMDINMPGLSAVEATRAVKQANPRTEIIVLTMYDNWEYIVEMVKAGAVGYILKDVEVDELVKAIQAGSTGSSVLHPRVASRLVNELNRRSALLEGGSGRDELAARLTAREGEVLALAAKGLSNRELGARLFISEKTVRNHMSNIRRKLGAKDRTQAVIRALRSGLVRLDS